MGEELEDRIAAFVRDVVTGMGVAAQVEIEAMDDGLKVRVRGGGSDILLRRRGEALDSLQHIVNTVFRRELADDRRIVVDCGGVREAKDAELRQMTRFLIDRVKSSGTPQELGPLNPYERRIVHVAVAESGMATSESVGTGFLKKVLVKPQ
jgi:spoIIIJ-associated protein